MDIGAAMPLSKTSLEEYIASCREYRARQEYRVMQLTDELTEAKGKLAEWDGAIASTQILLEMLVGVEQPESKATEA
jgi:hypothetical protein